MGQTHSGLAQERHHSFSLNSSLLCIREARHRSRCSFFFLCINSNVVVTNNLRHKLFQVVQLQEYLPERHTKHRAYLSKSTGPRHRTTHVYQGQTHRADLLLELYLQKQARTTEKAGPEPLTHHPSEGPGFADCLLVFLPEKLLVHPIQAQLLILVHLRHQIGIGRGGASDRPTPKYEINNSNSQGNPTVSVSVSVGYADLGA